LKVARICNLVGSSEAANNYSSIDSSGQINWSKLLFEELSEMMKKKEEELSIIK
jgi:hypothetical protein